LAADKIFSMCSDLGGFFLKIAQIIGKPDLAPAVCLSEKACYVMFDVEPLGSASIAQL
ncbi:putative aarF domain-containing protein kinase, partial [Trifolium pratense]